MKTRKSSNFKTKRLKYLKLRKKGGTETKWAKTKKYFMNAYAFFKNKRKFNEMKKNLKKDISLLQKNIKLNEKNLYHYTNTLNSTQDTFNNRISHEEKEKDIIQLQDYITRINQNIINKGKQLKDFDTQLTNLKDAYNKKYNIKFKNWHDSFKNTNFMNNDNSDSL